MATFETQEKKVEEKIAFPFYTSKYKTQKDWLEKKSVHSLEVKIVLPHHQILEQVLHLMFGINAGFSEIF